MMNTTTALKLSASIIWPNGKGETLCTPEYLALHDRAKAIKPDGVSMNDLSPADYQTWNELDHQMDQLQAEGHTGHSKKADQFADLDDDLDAAITGDKKAPGEAPVAAPVLFIEKCRKCGGSGSFVRGRFSGPCFACKGTGNQTFKTSKETRSAKKTQSKSAAIKKAEANLEAFKIAEPEVFAWFNGSTFGFAVAMREAVHKYGALTERQLIAAKGCIAKLEARKAETVARVVNAKEIDTAKIEEAFGKAASSLKAPKLRVAGMVISHAKASSKNAGALYVKSAERQNGEGFGIYLGKIMGGKFIRSRDCSDTEEASLMDVANDPKGAAIAYGRITGSCACCGRQLVDPESIKRGIGPICAGKFGW